ncbi:MAG: TadE/TadG family type IV pilus assembly protein [Desulfobaccales bacterium]
MTSNVLRVWRQWRRDTRGAVMVEFAVASLVFFLIIAGILDLGHAFYMRQVVTNASREGARYGVTYRTDTNGHRIPPCNITPSIASYLLNDYISQTLMPPDANPQVTVSGDGYTTGEKGTNLEVRVSAVKTWFILDNFIPGLGESITLEAATVMQCE